MPDLVINTGPIIALTAALGSLDFLAVLYREVIVPHEVFKELEVGGVDCLEIQAIHCCSSLSVVSTATDLPLLLSSQLDRGEAAVIQAAINHQVSTVVIDESLGRRMARLHQLNVTGSLGILVKAAKAGLITDVEACFVRMHEKDVWISAALKDQVREALGE